MIDEILTVIFGIVCGIVVIIILLHFIYPPNDDIFDSCDELAFHFAHSETYGYRFSDNACIMEDGQIWDWQEGHAINLTVEIK